MQNTNQFDPCTVTTENILEWIGNKDFEAAKEQAQRLAYFLLILADNKEAQKAIMKAGVPWIGAEVAKLIADSLLFDPNIDLAAQREALALSKKGYTTDSPELADAIKRMRNPQPKNNNQRRKSGAELFATILVPNTTSKSQFNARWIAAVALSNADMKIGERVAFINGHIEANNRILEGWKAGNRDSLEGFRGEIPRRTITEDQLKKACSKFKTEIDNANGIHRAK